MSFVLLGILNSQAAQGGVEPLGPGVAGYFLGGESSGGTVSTIDKFAFPSETRTTLASGMVTASQRHRSNANSGVAGYSSTGNLGSNIEKLFFSTDSSSTLATTLSLSRSLSSGAANSGTAGYWFAGNAFPTTYDVVSKINYASDITSTSNPVIRLRRAHTSAASKDDKAYVAGGQMDGGTSIDGSIEKYTFPTDTPSALAGTLSDAGTRRQLAGMADDQVAAYIGGGRTTAAVDKITFSTDTVSSTTSLSAGKFSLAGMANSQVAGYFGGSNLFVSTVERFAFPSDTRSTLATGLSVGRGDLSALSNQGS